MQKYFTHYWQNDTWDFHQQNQHSGNLLDHIAGNLFRKRGVSVEDIVYVVTVIRGELYLCGCLTVGKICKGKQAAKDLGVKASDLWQANEHIIASEATPMRWDLKVPLEITQKIKFASNTNPKLKFISSGKLDQQTLRGVRQLTADSAMLFDQLLLDSESPTEKDEIDEDFSFESFVEGDKTRRFVTTYERNPKLRKMALQIHGYDCKGCGFNFKNFYGDHGKNFIHVHHLNPVSEFDGAQEVNPETDLTVLCPNCHAMVHRFKSKTLSIEQLINLIQINA